MEWFSWLSQTLLNIQGDRITTDMYVYINKIKYLILTIIFH